MDSLLANYASSDEEEEQPKSSSSQTSSLPSKASSLFSSIPQPKSSTNFSSLPQPKQPLKSSAKPSIDDDEEDDVKPAASKTLFSSLPQPKSLPKSSIDAGGEEDVKPPSSKSLFSVLPQPKSQQPAASESRPKRIVQITPQIISKKELEDDDDDDEEEEKKRRQRKIAESSVQTSSVKSFLSSIPAPRNSSSLGVQQSSGSGRRAIVLETDTPVSSSADTSSTQNEVVAVQNSGNFDQASAHEAYNSGVVEHSAGSYPGYDAYGNYQQGYDPNAGVAADGSGYYDGYENYAGYGNYAEYGNYANYENNWGNGSASVASESTGSGDSALRALGKRGRNEVPAEIVEVKQDELMKNRPREDQVKMTGIAFGPSYRPVSAGAKPSKLHKRKHQIGSLYFDMKQKEMELAERRAKGFLTKAETQAKYGW